MALQPLIRGPFPAGASRGRRGMLVRPYANFSPTLFDPNSIANLYAAFYPSGSGSTWTDAKGGAGNGALANGATWSNGAVQFDGSNDEVNGFTNLLIPVSSRTLCVWSTNTDASFGRRGLIGTRSVSGGDGVFFGQYSSTQMIFATLGGSNYITTLTGGMPAANTPTFWALTHDTSMGTLTIYRDGTSVATSISSSWLNSGTAPSTFKGVIGAEQESQTSEHWQGSIKRALVYSRALTGTEIATLAANLS